MRGDETTHILTGVTTASNNRNATNTDASQANAGGAKPIAQTQCTKSTARGMNKPIMW